MGEDEEGGEDGRQCMREGEEGGGDQGLCMCKAVRVGGSQCEVVRGGTVYV